MTFSTEPGAHRDSAVLDAKLARLREAHIAPVTDLVEEIRRQTGLGVPYLDPDSGGVDARVLVLLRSPGKSAAESSGMLSPDNDRPTARNFWTAYAETELGRDRAIHWNAVPWYESGSEAAAQDADHWLLAFVDLLPRLRMVLGVGAEGYAAALRLATARPKGRFHVLHTPMPSQTVINASAPGEVVRSLHAAFRAAHELTKEDE